MKRFLFVFFSVCCGVVRNAALAQDDAKYHAILIETDELARLIDQYEKLGTLWIIEEKAKHLSLIHWKFGYLSDLCADLPGESESDKLAKNNVANILGVCRSKVSEQLSTVPWPAIRDASAKMTNGKDASNGRNPTTMFILKGSSVLFRPLHQNVVKPFVKIEVGETGEIAFHLPQSILRNIKSDAPDMQILEVMSHLEEGLWMRFPQIASDLYSYVTLKQIEESPIRPSAHTGPLELWSMPWDRNANPLHRIAPGEIGNIDLLRKILQPDSHCRDVF